MTTCVVAVLGYAWKGTPGAIWALIGGGIGVIATLVQVLVALGSAAGKEPKAVMRAFYRGSIAKLGVTVLLFVLALRGHKVVAAPMFSAYVATFLVYWVVLAPSLTPRMERND